ncbi:8498_t:CDS:2, partial [Scutellospora calospora]
MQETRPKPTISIKLAHHTNAKEDLESFETNSILVSSSNDLQNINDNITDDIDEHTVTYFTKELASNIICHTLTPIEYSETSLDSVAYIYNVEGWEELLSAFKDI